MSEPMTNYPMNAEQVTTMLRNKGINPTAQRVTIAQYLYAQPQHLSAEQILEGVNARDASVSKATVYNTLGLFSQKGLVREVLINPERIFYDSNLSAHYHLYNMDTGTLEDIPTDKVSIKALPELPSGCTLESLDVVLKVRNSHS